MSDYSELIRSLKAAAGGFADIAKDLAGAAGDKARDLAGGAGEKAKALAKLAKLTMELSAERDSLKDAYAEVGKLFRQTAENLVRQSGAIFVYQFGCGYRQYRTNCGGAMSQITGTRPSMCAGIWASKGKLRWYSNDSNWD